MIKDYYTVTELAKIWNCSRQYVNKIITEGKIQAIAEPETREWLQDKKFKIPLDALFYGTHSTLVLWGTPYKDGEQWKIKSRTKDGEHTHKIQEGE